MANLNTLITQFLEYLEIEKNRSSKTIRNYDFYLKRFNEWAGNSSPSGITQEKVRQYRLWLNRFADETGRELKKNTQNYHLIALRAFLKYLAKRDIKTLSAEKIELGKMPERVVDFLEGSDLERLLEAPTLAETPEIIKKRDKAIVEMLFSTGLRVSELANLKKEQVNLKKEEFTVRGKGDKPRIVFLSNQAKFWVKQYLEARQDVSPFLFVSHDRAHESEAALTPRSVERLVKKYSKIAGITKKVTPHTMRHSYATDLLMNGADIRSVQAMLGHSSITTTQIYTHITNQQLRDVHKSFHGRRRGK
ncbi:tyrosine-type recombinase/integrase [Candidatus Falkowbacteria bacterium]|nr:tyrosine-type recombinase/integrase [Candidatus Falkowbacteria bacterium]